MKIRFEEKMNSRYMVVCPENSEAVFSSFSYRMILENRIKGLIPCRIGNMDRKTMLYYNVTGLTRVSEYLREHAADEFFLKRFLRELAAVSTELQRYLIGSETILLDPEQLFVSADNGCFRFALSFEERNPFSDNLLKLSEYLIPRLPNNNHKAAAMGYELYQNCLSGLVTADSLQKIAETERKTETAVTMSPEEKSETGIPEDEIFIPRSKKRVNRTRKNLWKEVIAEKWKALKEKIVSFVKSLSDEP